jgi:hypothetical protein
MNGISNSGAVRSSGPPPSGVGLLTNFKVAQEGGSSDSSRPGSAKQVEGLLTDTELKRLRDMFMSGSGANYMIDQDQSVSGAAARTYMAGTGGLVRLPNDVVKSPIYFTQPAEINTATMLSRAFSGLSKTPGTQGLTGRMLALKPGQSFSFTETNNKLIDIRPLSENAELRKKMSKSDWDLVKTLGNATFNTKANVTVRYDGPAQGYTVTTQAQHTLLDRYNWNAGAKDSAEAAGRTSIMPDGNGGVFATNHADWFRMKALFGAKDYSVGLAATQTQTFKVSENQVRLGGLSTPGRVMTQMHGAGSATKAQVVTDGAAFKNQMIGASRDNRGVVPVGTNSQVSVMQPLRYDPKARPVTVPVDEGGDAGGSGGRGPNRIRKD